MKFYIVCAYRNRPDLLERCIASIQAQTDTDYDVLLADDASDEPMKHVAIPDGWYRWVQPTRIGVLGNQVTMIEGIGMSPEDVLVFLDGDDRFAHPGVLAHLRQVYTDDVWLTYGSYEPDPPHEGCSPAYEIPPDVLRRVGGYRRWQRGHQTAWNHLRTMRRFVFDAIPGSHFMLKGEWLPAGADYAIMTPAIELAGHHSRFIPETMVLYTSDRPDAEWRTLSDEIAAGRRYTASHKPLRPLRR